MSSWVFRSGRSLVSSGRRAVEADRRKMGWKPKRPKFEAEASCSRFGSRTAATWRGVTVTDDNDRNRVDVLMTSRDARHLDDANIAAAMIFLTFHREIDAVTVRNLLSTSFKKLTDWGVTSLNTRPRNPSSLKVWSQNPEWARLLSLDRRRHKTSPFRSVFNFRTEILERARSDANIDQNNNNSL